MDTGCNCKGPALRSYAHGAHVKNADLPTIPEAAKYQITPRLARLLESKTIRVWTCYNVHGSRGGPDSCSTLHIQADYYTTLTPERVAQIDAETTARLRVSRKKRHTRLLAELKQFAPDWRQDKWSGWQIVGLAAGIVLSPEGFEQQVMEVRLTSTSNNTRTVCVVRDDNGTFHRQCSLDQLQSRLSAEIPSRARTELFIRQGDIYFYPVPITPLADEINGSPCKESINDTRHVANGYKLMVRDGWSWRIYYAPGTRISAPDHPALVLSKWSEVQAATYGD